MIKKSTSVVFLLGIVFGGSTLAAEPKACFAPDTAPEVIESYMGSSGVGVKYVVTQNWISTATDGAVYPGQPLTLTWSIVPDGTSVAAGSGGGVAPSNLRAFLNGIYGSEDDWLPLIQQVFDRWEEVCGVTYQYIPADDMAQLGPANPGVSGVRADIRIGGKAVDGDGDILAFNWLPNDGADMVIDTSDVIYQDASSNSLTLRNVIAHEHGHGLGLEHVCPQNGTKLMEQIIIGKDGPQMDDIRGVQFLFGDPFEMNNVQATAWDLGTLVFGSNVFDLMSIRSTSEDDFYRITSPPGGSVRLSAKLVPKGGTYLSGSCEEDGVITQIKADEIHDLRIQLLDSSGVVLRDGNANPAGQTETLADLVVNASEMLFIKVESVGGVLDTQMYEIEIDVNPDNSQTALAFASEQSQVFENAGIINLPIIRSGDLSRTTVVQFSAVEETATNGIDFDLSDGGFTFLPGETIKVINIPIIDNALADGERNFFVGLTTGAADTIVTDNEAAVQIFDDEQPCNLSSITIGTSSSGGVLTASPYPSSLQVSGMSGVVRKVAVELRNISHAFPRDIDLLLVGPQGQHSILMSDMGGTVPMNGVTLTFDEDANQSLTFQGSVFSGSYRPADVRADNFPTPAPSGPYIADLSVFSGTDPNGTWALYAVDDFAKTDGLQINGGWCLSIEMEPQFQVTGCSFQNGIGHFEFPTLGGYIYVLESSVDLVNWVEVQSASFVGNLGSFSEPLSIPGRQFYRIHRR